MAFALLILLTAFTCLLAVLQDAVWLAVFGIVGGFAAPILASTGHGSHVALFSYYAVLNAGILAIALKRSWRLLNLLGFAFTFVIGTAWGVLRYRPEDYASVQGFLALFFIYYVAIAILYASRQAPRLRHYVDGTLVFGTPLLGFGLQPGQASYDAALHALGLGFVFSMVFGHAPLIAPALLQQLVTEAAAPRWITKTSRRSVAALAKAEMVVTLSPFKANLEGSDVLLPIAPFTETSGSFVNAEGRLQSFHAVVKPRGETRPAWKVLRVLGNLLDVPGFNFETSQDVLAKVTAQPLQLSNALRAEVRLGGAVSEPAVAAIYQLDGTVRRAPSLQLTADARQAQKVSA